MPKVVKVALCLPWYAGSDPDTCANNLSFAMYLTRLQERTYWLNRSGWKLEGLSPLDPNNTTGRSEIGPWLEGTEFQFGVADEIGCSLVGMARERVIDNALAWGADYIMMWDDDMLFGTDIFLRLYAADKPLVAALAFTGRSPLVPVAYRYKAFAHNEAGIQMHSDPIMDYKRDTLQKVDGVGFGFVLFKSEVFRRIPKPWMHNPSVGEDIQFCARMKQFGLEVWMDTGAKTIHKPTFHARWHDELMYDAQQRGDCVYCGTKGVHKKDV